MRATGSIERTVCVQVPDKTAFKVGQSVALAMRPRGDDDGWRRYVGRVVRISAGESSITVAIVEDVEVMW